jgi:tRNA (guanine-N7-)-methyltransferase
MRADGEELPNLRFVRARVDHITQFFGPAELSEIWITFPDPFLKYRRRSRRMTAPNFLERYRHVLAPKGCIHLKTDSPELFDFTLETLADEGLDKHIKTRIDDIYAAPDAPELLTAIQTYYEKMHLEKGRRIKYLSFSF